MNRNRATCGSNQRGTAEQWIKEGKNAVKWTRLSCRTMNANAVRLQLHALAYSLSNFLRAHLGPPGRNGKLVSHHTREKVVKIGAKIITHARYAVFQMAEVAMPRDLFRRVVDMIDDLSTTRASARLTATPIRTGRATAEVRPCCCKIGRIAPSGATMAVRVANLPRRTRSSRHSAFP